MSFATGLQTTASTLLTTYGQALTFTRVAEGDYNPVDSSTGPATTTTYTGKGHPSAYTAIEVDGTLIQQKDVKLTLYTTGTPAVDDAVTLDTVVYRVMSVEKVNAQGLTIIYKLQLRS